MNTLFPTAVSLPRAIYSWLFSPSVAVASSFLVYAHKWKMLNVIKSRECNGSRVASIFHVARFSGHPSRLRWSVSVFHLFHCIHGKGRIRASPACMVSQRKGGGGRGGALPLIAYVLCKLLRPFIRRENISLDPNAPGLPWGPSTALSPSLRRTSLFRLRTVENVS